MGFHPFTSIRSNPYYEKPPVKPHSPRPQLRDALAAKLESSHSYTALPAISPAEKRHGDPSARLRSINDWSEWIQLGVRILLLAGAIGLLVCAFIIRNLQIAQSYTVRVPPLIDALMTTYFIYRLLARCGEQHRNTGASQHFLALVIDAGLIPFYVFIALLARGAPGVEVDLHGTQVTAWTSIFHGAEATQKVVLSIWLLAMIVGGLHIFAFVLSSSSFFAFCCLSRLETARDTLESHPTMRPSKTRSRDIPASSRNIQHRSSPQLAEQPEDGRRPVSFLQTRSNGDNRYSPYNPKTAVNASRLNLDLPALPIGTQALRSGSPCKGFNIFTSHPDSSVQSFSGSSFYSDEDGVPPLPRKSSKRRSDVPSEAYSAAFNPRYAYESALGNMRPAVAVIEINQNFSTPPPQLPVLRASSSISAFDFALPNTYRGAAYRSLPQDSPTESSEHLVSQMDSPKAGYQRPFKTSRLQPLNMNPPTPPLDSKFTVPLGNSSPSALTTKLDKSRFYGDLGTGSDIGTRGTDGPAVRGGGREDQQSRVISRSGADIGDAGSLSKIGVASEDGECDTSYTGAGGVLNSGLRGRVVSGKVAEEGRVGNGVHEVLPEEESENSGRRGWGSGRWFQQRSVW